MKASSFHPQTPLHLFAQSSRIAQRAEMIALGYFSGNALVHVKSRWILLILEIVVCRPLAEYSAQFDPSIVLWLSFDVLCGDGEMFQYPIAAFHDD